MTTFHQAEIQECTHGTSALAVTGKNISHECLHLGLESVSIGYKYGVTTGEMTTTTLRRNTRRTNPGQSVLGELEQLHSSLRVGDAFPSYRQLLKQLEVPERSLVWALRELERQGKIERRVGRGGSVVTGPAPQHTPGPGSDDWFNGRRMAAMETERRTLVVIAEPDGSIFDRALQLLARQPNAADFVLNCRLMRHEESESFEWPASQSNPLGFLLLRQDFEPLARKLAAQGQRVVLLGRPSDGGAGVPNVYGDQHEGGLILTRHLLKLGHRNFLVQGRTVAVEAGLAESGTSASSQTLFENQVKAWGHEPALAREFFSRPGAPTALVAWNDHDAIRLLTLLNRAGLRVPEDVTLVGYDNLPQSAFTFPPLTTVDSAIERQLSAALKLLTQEKPPPSNQSIVIMPTLISRQSSAAPRP